jgi:hypothetical protein
MAAPTYSTDLTDISTASNVANWVATGGGSAALNDETDYFIQGTQCISKNGFTATQKGQMYDAGTAPTITSGDAVFVWGRQANRNLLDTVANSGGAVIMGTSNSVFAGFNVDGNDVEGSDLLSWVSYAVDPTQTSDYSSGSPGAASTWDHFGMEWQIGGSGSLKGAPNAVDAIRHGRELRAVDGDLGNGYATFTGMAAYDSATTRRYGILTEATGTLLFHGALVLGQSGTSVDFRDSNVSISVLDDPHVPTGFNEIEIQNASSNVEWTGIQIAHLAASPTSRTTLTLDVGTFTGESCRFDGCAQTTFGNSSDSCILTTWQGCDRINLNQADISGSSILESIVAADEGAIFDDRTTSGNVSISELDDCTISIGANAHHAIRFGANVTHDITLTGIEFTGFSSTNDANNSTLRFDATSGSINVNLIGCTVDGNPATTSNIGVDDAAGISVTLVVDPVTTKFTVQELDGTKIQNARVLAETADNGGGSGFPFEAAVSSLTQSAGTATLTASSAHGLATNDFVVVRGAQPDGYNKVAQITVTSTTVFTYSVDSGLAGTATGTPIFSYAAIGGALTDVNGEVTSSKTWPASQGLKGWARKSTSAPYFKESAISVADASGGTDAVLTLLSDE